MYRTDMWNEFESWFANKYATPTANLADSVCLSPPPVASVPIQPTHAPQAVAVQPAVPATPQPTYVPGQLDASVPNATAKKAWFDAIEQKRREGHRSPILATEKAFPGLRQLAFGLG